MEACERFTITYASQVKRHLQTIARRYHALIRKAIEEQLTFTPDTQTRNRKPLRLPAPFEASWEIRCGLHNRFRVFYDVRRAECAVHVLAIGEKSGSRLYIGGEEIDA